MLYVAIALFVLVLVLYRTINKQEQEILDLTQQHTSDQMKIHQLEFELKHEKEWKDHFCGDQKVEMVQAQ